MDEKRLLLGDRIRQTRRARGISQIQLAEMAQISVSHMSDIETGKTNISLDVFIRIMNALHVSSDWLLQTNASDESEALDKEFTILLSDCSLTEKQLILNMAREMKKGLRTSRE